MEVLASQIHIEASNCNDATRATRNLDILFVFDDARNLLSSLPEKDRVDISNPFSAAISTFHVIGRGLSGFPCRTNNIFAFFIDIFPRLPNFRPRLQFSDDILSYRPRRLFPPIWQLATLEVWDECFKVGHFLKDVIKPEWYYKYGRACLFAAIKAAQPDKARRVAQGLLNVIKEKLKSTGMQSQSLRLTIIAALNSRLCIDIAGHYRLAPELAFNCMQF